MPYILKWMQHRDGGVQPAEQDFDDLKAAKEFCDGLGEVCQAKLFDADTDEQVWPELSDKESAKQREASSMQNIKTPAGIVDPNGKGDTRSDAPEDLRQMMASGTATADPMSVLGTTQPNPLRSAAKPKPEADAGDDAA